MLLLLGADVLFLSVVGAHMLLCSNLSCVLLCCFMRVAADKTSEVIPVNVTDIQL